MVECQAPLDFLAFTPAYTDLAEKLADAVTRHATPVGSGITAWTGRIPTHERAKAAVFAWMRHQTTAYDQMKIPRIKGKRRGDAEVAGRGVSTVNHSHTAFKVHFPSAVFRCHSLGLSVASFWSFFERAGLALYSVVCMKVTGRSERFTAFAWYGHAR